MGNFTLAVYLPAAPDFYISKMSKLQPEPNIDRPPTSPRKHQNAKMAPPTLEKGTKRRSPSINTAAPQSPSKKSRQAAPSKAAPANGQTPSPLLTPHTPILKELGNKYDILPLSIISSTPITKRITQITKHLQSSDASAGEKKKPKIVLLHARPAEVCKMITVVEQCKRALAEQGLSWWQYNELFDLPEELQQRQKKKKVDGVDVTVVEETKLPEKEGEDDDEDSDSEDDAFETMQDRFEKAVGSGKSERKTKSLRIFLSTEAVPAVRSREGVTSQSSQDS